MQLTRHQQWCIREWALHTPYVQEVRLFGSRARGEAKPDSDIDLAITVGGSDQGNIFGNYFAERPRWQEQLTHLLEAKAHVEGRPWRQLPDNRAVEWLMGVGNG